MFGFKSKAKEDTIDYSQSIAILEQGIKKLCAGDFTVKLELPQGDPLASIARLVNQYSQNNTQLLLKTSMVINDAVSICLHEGDKLNHLADNFEGQTKHIGQVAVSITQLTDSVIDLAQSTAETSEHTSEGKSSMELASESVKKVSVEAGVAQSSVVVLNQQVNELYASTAQIDQLVSVVKGVADQTNLLALNAAIEAARAGEYGRGFSVVAEEVRKLADQSNKSVGEITQHLTEIRSEVSQIKAQFQSMDVSFQHNAEYVSTASDSVQKLIEVFDGIDAAVQNLAPIAQEQSANFEEMSATVDTIAKQTNVTNETLQSCNAEIFEVLNSFNDIRTEIGSFQLGFDPGQIIDLAKTDHLMWKTRINFMLRGITSLNADNVQDHSICRLGKWYFGIGKNMFGHLSTFKNLDGMHKEFHSKCADAIKYYKLGELARAKKLAEEIDVLSSKVMEMLDEIKREIR